MKAQPRDLEFLWRRGPWNFMQPRRHLNSIALLLFYIFLLHFFFYFECLESLSKPVCVFIVRKSGFCYFFFPHHSSNSFTWPHHQWFFFFFFLFIYIFFLHGIFFYFHLVCLLLWFKSVSVSLSLEFHSMLFFISRAL
jgi:hypothetical protein